LQSEQALQRVKDRHDVLDYDIHLPEVSSLSSRVGEGI
jgi:hypothetical protein